MLLKHLILIAMTGFAATSALAGSIAEQGVAAERLVGEGDPLGALAALEAATSEVWTKMPMQLRNVALIESATGYGIYVPRESDVFAQGEAVLIYVEPLGYLYGKNSVGAKEIALDVDLDLLDASGDVVFSKTGLVELRQPVRYDNREFFLTVDLNLTGAPAGKYVGKFTLRDGHSKKNAAFDMPFEVAP